MTTSDILSSGTGLLEQVELLGSLSSTAPLDNGADLLSISKIRSVVGGSSDIAGIDSSTLGIKVGQSPISDYDRDAPSGVSLSSLDDSGNITGSTLFNESAPQFATAKNLSDGSEPLKADSLTGMAENAQLVGSRAVAQAGNLQVLTPFPDRSIVKNRIIFSTVNEEKRAAKPLIVSNTGTGPLTITKLSFGNGESKAEADFELVNPPAAPFTLQPGASRTVSIKFAPKGDDGVASLRRNNSPTHTKNGEQYDSLKIASNDPDRPTAIVKLAGLNAANYEADNEPSVAEIARIFGFTFDVGTEGKLGRSKTPLGDEVYSPYWVQADTSKPVLLRPLAVFSGRTDTPHDFVSFKAKPGSGGKSGLIYQLAGRANDDSPDAPPNPPYEGKAVLGSNSLSGGENQKLLPKVLVKIDGKLENSLPTIDRVDFTPTSPFALVTNGSSTNDSQNGSEKLRNWRMFPVGNPKTTTTWFAAVDPGNNPDPRTGKNFDNNDDVYLLVNARPESMATKA